MMKTDHTYIQKTLRPRRRDAHKGDFGKVLLFAGSVGMAGAAVLCGRAALKSGAGLVQYLLPDYTSPLLPILQTAVPEATCVEHTPALRLSSYTAIAAGSGLGQSETARSILEEILEVYSGILVLDADALNMIAAHEELAEGVRRCAAQVILTPHIGEARRLLHTDARIADPSSRQEAACSLAEQYQSIAVLKGAGTLVAWQDPAQENQEFFIARNTTGNPGMATAGSGDALTGLIVSLAAQGYAPSDAARMGVYFHGLAGDLAAKELGEMGLTSTDIVTHIPHVIQMTFQ